jgi:hypothetical protein
MLAFAVREAGRADLPAAPERPQPAHAASIPSLRSAFSHVRGGLIGIGRALVAALPDRRIVSLVRFDGPAADTGGDDTADDNTGSIGAPSKARAEAGPDVNRAAKGDFLIPRLQLDILNEAMRPPAPTPGDDAADNSEDLQAAARYQPFPEYDVAMSLELRPSAPTEGIEDPVDGLDMEMMFGAARVYFDPAPVGVRLAVIEPYTAGDAPVLLVPTAVANAPSADAPVPPAEKSGPSKAEIASALNGLSPAARLRLDGKARARAERCLANAVYFEARGESVRGQIAVAQVVLNRAFSGFYPRDICGVVYQGAHRHLSCQFTFACDGIPDVVTEPAAWARAERIANATLDGKVWLSDVGKATHYHAYWVHPSWTRSMHRLQKIGVHSFYRPRNWGDGADAPSWGTVPAAAMAAKL